MQSARWLASDPNNLPVWTYKLAEQITKAVQEISAKIKPDEDYYWDSSRGSTQDE